MKLHDRINDALGAETLPLLAFLGVDNSLNHVESIA